MRDNGDWESWLAFFLRGVVKVSRQSTSTAAAILRMREEYRARITARLGQAAANGHRVMDRLFDHPIVNVATVSEWIGVKSAAANNLVKGGLLREVTYARNRRFRFDPLLAAF